MKYFRSKKLMAAVHSLPCQIELEGCLVRPAVPCHGNGPGTGKGMGIKAHDCFIAAGCTIAVGRAGCHHEIDDGKKLSREERRNAWRTAWHKTFVLLYGMRLIHLPRIDAEECVRLNGGVSLMNDNEPTRIVFPSTVPDPAWLQMWLDKRAYVL